MNQAVLVTARTQSSRLAKKPLLQLGGHSVIEHVLERISGWLPSVILCTTDLPADDELVALCEFKGQTVFRGHPTNKIVRWANAVEEFNLDQVHTLDADDLFFDPIEIVDSMSHLRGQSLDLVHTSFRSDRGMASVGTSFDSSYLLRLANRSSRLLHQDLDTIPWQMLEKSQDKIHRMPNRDYGCLLKPVRLTLDYEEDYKFFCALVENLDPQSTRFQVEEFLSRNLELSEINEFRSEEFQKRQSHQRATFVTA